MFPSSDVLFSRVRASSQTIVSYCTVCTETYIRTKNVLAGIAIVIIVSMSIVDISVDSLKFSCEDTNITSKLCTVGAIIYENRFEVITQFRMH